MIEWCWQVNPTFKPVICFVKLLKCIEFKPKHGNNLNTAKNCLLICEYQYAHSAFIVATIALAVASFLP